LLADAPINVVSCQTGDPASRGGLRLTMTPLNNLIGEPSDQAIQSLTRMAATYGPKASGVIGTGLATVTGSGTPFTVGGQTFQTGNIVVNVSSGIDSREGDVELIQMEDVGQSDYNDILFLRFPAGRTTNIRCKIHVPAQNLPTNPMMTLYFWFLALTTGTLPSMPLSRRILTSPSVATPKRSLPLVETTMTALAPGAGQTGTTAYQYIVLASEAFAVAADDTVFFTLERQAAGGDGYAGDVGLLRMRWLLTPG